MERDALDHALLAAHAEQNTAELVRLYTIAADQAEARQDIDAASFFLTHAFVFALEDGAPQAVALNQRLAQQGRAKLIEF